MTDLRILVVDDEPIVRRDLVRLLATEPNTLVVGEARNGLEALDMIEQLNPNVVFLDVEMPELDGLGVVAGLDPERTPAIVFVTAFGHYALPAFDLHAVDYLLKPFDATRCRTALDRVRERLAGARARDLDQVVSALVDRTGAPRYLERLAVRGSDRTRILDLAEVTWIEAADNYVRLHCASGKHLSRRTMRDLEQTLDPARFARIHRSAIVNLLCVRELRPHGDGDYELRLADGVRLTLTRSYRGAFEARFGGVA